MARRSVAHGDTARGTTGKDAGRRGALALRSLRIGASAECDSPWMNDHSAL